MKDVDYLKLAAVLCVLVLVQEILRRHSGPLWIQGLLGISVTLVCLKMLWKLVWSWAAKHSAESRPANGR
jgi:hypothetical protein